MARERQDAGTEVEHRAPMDLVFHVARDLRRTHHSALAPWDISPHQARALTVIADHEEPRLGVIAERLRITPRAATEVADALAERGLIERQPDPSDRRAVVVRLTTAGRKAQKHFRQVREAAGTHYFACLSEAERSQLSRLLSTVLAAHEHETAATT